MTRPNQSQNYVVIADDAAAATPAAARKKGGSSTVDAEARRMMLFAEGSPLAMTLDVLEAHPEVRARFLEAVGLLMEEKKRGYGGRA